MILILSLQVGTCGVYIGLSGFFFLNLNEWFLRISVVSKLTKFMLVVPEALVGSTLAKDGFGLWYD